MKNFEPFDQHKFFTRKFTFYTIAFYLEKLFSFQFIQFIYFVAFGSHFFYTFRFRCFCSADFLHFITEILFCTYTQSTLYSYTIDHFILFAVMNAHSGTPPLYVVALVRHSRSHTHIHSNNTHTHTHTH